MDNYTTWLKKEIKKSAVREDRNMMNYQASGEPRYLKAQYREEYLSKALSTALQIEKGHNPKVDSCQRAFQGILETLEKYLLVHDIDGALRTIKTYKTLGL